MATLPSESLPGNDIRFFGYSRLVKDRKRLVFEQRLDVVTVDKRVDVDFAKSFANLFYRFGRSDGRQIHDCDGGVALPPDFRLFDRERGRAQTPLDKREVGFEILDNPSRGPRITVEVGGSGNRAFVPLADIYH